MALEFDWLDVFGETPLSGNQLAVCFDAARLSTERMQAIARETNLSETTFVLTTSPVDGAWPTRIFTPQAELPFAGHPTLGTAWAIRRRYSAGVCSQVVLDLKAGRVPVAFEDEAPGVEVGWMTQRPAEFGKTFDRELVASALSLEVGDIVPNRMPQMVSTGFGILVVPLASMEALRRCKIEAEPYDD